MSNFYFTSPSFQGDMSLYENLPFDLHQMKMLHGSNSHVYGALVISDVHNESICNSYIAMINQMISDASSLISIRLNGMHGINYVVPQSYPFCTCYFASVELKGLTATGKSSKYVANLRIASTDSFGSDVENPVPVCNIQIMYLKNGNIGRIEITARRSAIDIYQIILKGDNSGICMTAIYHLKDGKKNKLIEL